MRHRHILYLLPVIIAIALASCGDDATGPSSDPTVTAKNGLLIERAGSGKTAINLEDASSSIIWDSSARATILTATGESHFAKRASVSHGDEHEFELKLTIPGHTAGTYDWSNTTPGGEKTGLAITIDSVDYAAVDGSTVISSYGEVGGNISGTFSGTLASGSGDTVTISGGVFSAKRGADRMPLSPNSIVVDGDGFSNFTIDLGDGSGAIGWVYSNPDYITLLVSATTMIAPGQTGTAALAIDYSDNITGVQVWGVREHSKVTLRLDNRYYVSQTGATQVRRLGTGLLGEISGVFSGTMVNAESGAPLQVKSARFLGWRGN